MALTVIAMFQLNAESTVLLSPDYPLSIVEPIGRCLALSAKHEKDRAVWNKEFIEKIITLHIKMLDLSITKLDYKRKYLFPDRGIGRIKMIKTLIKP